MSKEALEVRHSSPAMTQGYCKQLETTNSLRFALSFLLLLM